MRLRAPITVLCGLPAFACAQALFIPLGDLPGAGFGSGSHGISSNGSAVVGSSEARDGYAGHQAFRWTADQGMVNLGTLPGNWHQSNALGVSHDGRFVVGGTSSFEGYQAFLWSEATGMVGLGDLPGRDFLSNAHGVSANGRVVVGESDSAENFDGGTQAFRWTPQTGMVGLGFLPGHRNPGSVATDVSADGSVIVGRTNSATGQQGFRWTEQTGMVALPSLPNGLPGENAVRMGKLSPNGRFATGSDLNSDLDWEAVLWTDQGEAIGLGYLPGGNEHNSHANDVSNDGRVVVGRGQNSGAPNGGYYGFVWTPDGGMVNIHDALLADGLDVVELGWFLRRVNGVSADGHWLCGDGINPDGFGEAWLAYLPSIPTPATLAPLAAVLLAGGRRR